MKALKLIFGVSLLFPGFLLAASGVTGSSSVQQSYEIDDAVAGHEGRGRVSQSEAVPGHEGQGRAVLNGEASALVDAADSLEFNLNGQNYFCYPSPAGQFYE